MVLQRTKGCTTGPLVLQQASKTPTAKLCHLGHPRPRHRQVLLSFSSFLHHDVRKLRHAVRTKGSLPSGLGFRFLRPFRFDKPRFPAACVEAPCRLNRNQQSNLDFMRQCSMAAVLPRPSTCVSQVVRALQKSVSLNMSVFAAGIAFWGLQVGHQDTKTNRQMDKQTDGQTGETGEWAWRLSRLLCGEVRPRQHSKERC